MIDVAPIAVPAAAKAFLTAAGLQRRDDDGIWSPLTGGVSSELWRVALPDGSAVAVKGALARLRVEAEWNAPVSRNAVEFEWLQFAGAVAPGSVPRVFAHDAEVGLFAMEYLDPATHPVWKMQLLAGDVDPGEAEAVGDLVGRLHAASRQVQGLPYRFATDDNFDSLRIDPYFRATARRHPEVADEILGVAARTAATHVALVHGDVSPKNILVGTTGPVLLDAECAWWGDPAFDVAFCLTHLALKALVVPGRSGALRDSARRLIDAQFSHVDWEPLAALSGRAATLLPVLLLARVDGASPVDYLSNEHVARVRGIALELIHSSGSSVLDVVDAWYAAAARSAPSS